MSAYPITSLIALVVAGVAQGMIAAEKSAGAS
jgi:hypothetical protein